MNSIETNHSEMDFYIDQEGKLHIYFTEEEIRVQDQIKKGSKDILIRSEY
jgi:hypothetical protein